ncbi:unnamed protein product, partial [Darwinula stevensoni]
EVFVGLARSGGPVEVARVAFEGGRLSLQTLASIPTRGRIGTLCAYVWNGNVFLLLGYGDLEKSELYSLWPGDWSPRFRQELSGLGSPSDCRFFAMGKRLALAVAYESLKIAASPRSFRARTV